MNLSQIGLILDIIGVLILFEYGLPSKIKDIQYFGWDGDKTPEMIKKEKDDKKIRLWAKIGLGFVIAGFLFQLGGSSSFINRFTEPTSYKPNGEKSNSQ